MKLYQLIGLGIVGVLAAAVVVSAWIGQPLVEDVPFALIMLGIVAGILVGWVSRVRRR